MSGTQESLTQRFRKRLDQRFSHNTINQLKKKKINLLYKFLPLVVVFCQAWAMRPVGSFYAPFFPSLDWKRLPFTSIEWSFSRTYWAMLDFSGRPYLMREKCSWIVFFWPFETDQHNLNYNRFTEFDLPIADFSILTIFYFRFVSNV